jgi:hypothetical protein
VCHLGLVINPNNSSTVLVHENKNALIFAEISGIFCLLPAESKEFILMGVYPSMAKGPFRLAKIPKDNSWITAYAERNNMRFTLYDDKSQKVYDWKLPMVNSVDYTLVSGNNDIYLILLYNKSISIQKVQINKENMGYLLDSSQYKL